MKKTAKSQFSMLGTVDDGVKKEFLTASNIKNKNPRVHDGVKLGRHVYVKASPKAVTS